MNEPGQKPAGNPTLEVEGVIKSFGSFTALQELSFQAHSKEIIGLLGPNGAGKTTVMRILSTILAPSRGSFSIDGIPHTHAAAIRARIGVLPESSGYPLQQTGAEFLQYFARLFGHSAKPARALANELLAEVDLTRWAQAPIATYSRGMKQRLGVARALINDPSVILLDEPTLGLDPAGQRQILQTIREVAAQRGATVILSTHFLEEVEETCSRVLILNRGALRADGSIAEVKLKAAAPRQGHLRLPPDMQAAALTALRQELGFASVQPSENRQDILTLTLNPDAGDGQASTVNQPIKVLVGAGVPILSFELEGSKLSDAFLAMTGDELQ